MKTIATLLGCATIVFVCGAAVGNIYQEKAMYEQYVKALEAAKELEFKRGYSEGESSVDWKKRALSDHDMTRKLCKAWWFDSNVTERKVK